METLTLGTGNSQELRVAIDKAVDHLEEGSIVALPTETVYGLAANALNAEACASIFEAKQRPNFDPLI
ncbi:MAG: Sua5/YciO/YrdC/YwlC family protein, partial [Verrucomicrobiota bacterium]|nr:Sua5/YciO/YrdC/YwlC family protein [Verrucomicrobiota bacterium]